MDSNISCIDLHIHSTASDGTFTPEELIDHAEKCGLKAISVTDHDTVQGSIEALKIKSDKVSVISGIEISSYPPQFEEFKIKGSFHILGYLFDTANKDLIELTNKLRSSRDTRNPMIIEKLNALGFKIDIEEVKEFSGGQVGRPHIANVMMNKGYVKSINEAFDIYLGTGGKAHVGKFQPDSGSVIDIIKNAGGIPVLAHPGLLELSQDQYKLLFEELKNQGLMGIEAYYTKHDKKQTEFFIDCAKNLKMIVTGGSDYHGENKENVEMGVGEGDLKVPFELFPRLNKLKENNIR